MAFNSPGKWARSRKSTVALAALLLAASGCAMAGFGGSLQLNVTDEQIRALTIEVDAGDPDAQLIEVNATGEIELGTGAARIERYVLHRATFGRDLAVGYFLCPKPCTDPLNTYLVAYSPEQLFDPDGTLELRFRIVSAAGTQELSRSINAEMLPELWRSPTIEARPAGR